MGCWSSRARRSPGATHPTPPTTTATPCCKKRRASLVAVCGHADACGVGTLPVAGAPASVEIDLHPDAAGDDNVNLNDEWVRFTNTGTAPLDLAGWTVSDESSTHRYTFADLVVQPGDAVTLFTGCGTDTATERYWCNSDSAVWNNGGDTVFLHDPAGNIVASRSY